MNIKSFVMAAAFSLGVLMNAGNASAATVDFSGYNVDMGTVAVGQTGTIDPGHFSNAIYSQITGALPSNSMITFTYTFAGDLAYGWLGTAGQYSYTDGPDSYAGVSIDTDPLAFGASSGSVNGSPSTPLVFASAQIDFGANTATAIIKNFSADVASYLNIFGGVISSGGKTVEIAYNVSAVPLPAALPLFGLGLAAMAGYGARRRKDGLAALAA